MQNNFIGYTIIDKIINDIQEDRVNVTEAFFDNYPLSDNQVKKLSDALERNNNLSYLNLYNCRLSNKNLEMILNALKINTGVKTIIINRGIGQELYDEFMNSVAKNNSNLKP